MPMMTALANRPFEHQPVFSWSREHAGTVYTSGHVAIDLDTQDFHYGDLAHEARVALGNLEQTLERAGSSLAKTLKVTVYLADMADFAALNRVYAEFFSGDHTPARTCVEVSGLPYGLRIAIDAVAHT